MPYASPEVSRLDQSSGEPGTLYTPGTFPGHSDWSTLSPPGEPAGSPAHSTYVNTCSSVDGREREREKERETFFQIANYSGLPPLPEYWWKLKER